MSDWVIGVDPGKSSGIFALRDGRRHLAYQGTTDFFLVLEGLLQEAARELADVLVAMERFNQGSRRHTHQADAQRAIGTVLALAARYGAPVVLQSPADAKAFMSNDRLRELDLWVVPAEVDAPDADDVRDAARHALLCLATHRAQTYVALVDEFEARRRRGTID